MSWAVDNFRDGAADAPVSPQSHPEGHWRLDSWDRELWLVSVLFFGVGDVLTTAVGLQIGGAVETNPVLSAAEGPALYLTMVGLKLLVFGGWYLLWRVTPAPYRVGAPLGLAILGVAATALNLVVMFTAIAG